MSDGEKIYISKNDGKKNDKQPGTAGDRPEISTAHFVSIHDREALKSELAEHSPGSFLYEKEIAQKRPFSALERFDQYKDKPWSKDIMSIICQKDPLLGLSSSFIYKQYSGIEDLITLELVQKVAQKSPLDVLSHVHAYEDKPWVSQVVTQDLLEIVMEKDPELVLRRFFLYKNEPWAPDILKQIAKIDPHIVAQLLTTQNGSWKDDVLSVVAAEGSLHAEERRQIAQIAISRETRDQSSSKMIDLLKDSSLEGLSDVEKNWFISEFEHITKISGGNVRFLVDPDSADKNVFYNNLHLLITRNLFFQGKTINEQNVRHEVHHILAACEQYAHIPIFSGRNVVFAAHVEKDALNSNDTNLFGKKAFLEKIQMDGGHVSQILRAEDSPVSLQETKDKILAGIINSPPPFTFIFDGHGLPDGLYLSHGENTDTASNDKERVVKIGVQDFFNAYHTRQKKFSNQASTPKTKDIIVASSCFSANFIRDFFTLCDAHNLQKPIFLGPSEYGQFGFSSSKYSYGNEFFHTLFQGPGKHEGKAVLGNVILNDSINRESNSSLILPDESGITIQIADLLGQDLSSSKRI